MKSMKKLVYVCIMLAAVGSICSCSKNEMPVYDTERSALNIWFGRTNTLLDSTTYNYSYVLDEGSLTFMARVAGIPVDYDRSFTLEVVDGDISEAEGSYRIDTYTIPAGKVEVECPIYFNTSKLKNENSFVETDGHLYFRVAENSEFETGVDSRSQLVVVLKNYLAEPEEWNNTVSPYLPWYRYFGDYSKVKYQFMIQELGIMEFHIYASAVSPYNEETNEMSINYAQYLAEVLAEALDEYEAAHGERLTDEFGREVEF